MSTAEDTWRRAHHGKGRPRPLVGAGQPHETLQMRGLPILRVCSLYSPYAATIWTTHCARGHLRVTGS
jgi:hypothetical protein